MMQPSALNGLDVAAIQQQATKAASTYTCINAACPYPFFTEAGHIFKSAFLQERDRIRAACHNPPIPTEHTP